ncbi:MAG: HyaD/HybD family hydrogenase maturation endopeptidase [Planctomycetes bacterium]|nr:HyaD/HybD family hydrogenase maturation endopeptidase [Planctomycetota bacterium]
MVAAIAVLGLGSPLMTDEGIGIRILEALERRADLPEDVELVDLGTGGLRIVHEAAGRRKLVVVDCARMGEPPGTIRRFTPEEVRSRKVTLRWSLHEGDVLANLELARRLGTCPEEVVLLGIQPERVAPGLELTATLAARLEEYVGWVLAELRPAEKAGPERA